MAEIALLSEGPKPDEATKSGQEEEEERKPVEGETKSKRALKREKKRAEWLANKGERRAKERVKRRLKRERKTRENDYEMSYSASRKRLKEATMAASAAQIEKGGEACANARSITAPSPPRS